jgi:hypothetical protein
MVSSSRQPRASSSSTPGLTGASTASAATGESWLGNAVTARLERQEIL